MLKRLIASLICLTFSFSNLQYVQAQEFSINQLPVPGKMISTTPAFIPLTLKGMVIHPENALMFDFLMDTGYSNLKGNDLSDEALKIMKYFLTALTIPEDDLWVNLSPYEKGRILQDNFGQTMMGRDLLAEDYVLKQLTASLIYPEKALGKEFWQQVYSRATQELGTTQILVNTFNKVWIVPSEAVVWEHEDKVIIVKSHLKVMLEEDYLALSKHQGQLEDMFKQVQEKNVSPSALPSGVGLNTKAPQVKNFMHNEASQIVRQIILPVLEKEVNEGKNFAQLRQMYQAMILATWYKKALRESILNKVYANQKKTKGVDNINAGDVETIYQLYLKAFKKGAFNYIKEDIDPATGQTMPRKYFSGGFSLDGAMTTSFTKTVLIVLAGGLLTLSSSQQGAIAQASKSKGKTVIVHGNMREVGNGTHFQTRPTTTAKKLKDQKAIDSIIEKMMNESLEIKEGNDALEQLGADREIIFQLNINILKSNEEASLGVPTMVSSSRKLDALSYVFKLGDERAIEPIVEGMEAADKITPAGGYFYGIDEMQGNQDFKLHLFIRMLDLPNYRGKAIDYLTELKDKRAITPIREHLDDFSSDRDSVRYALRELGATWWETVSNSERIELWLALAGIAGAFFIYKRKDIRFAKLKWTGNAEGIARILNEAERKGQYETYNIASDALHGMGDSRGIYFYKKVGHHIRYETEDSYGNPELVETLVFSWVKEKRSDSIMIGGKILEQSAVKSLNVGLINSTLNTGLISESSIADTTLKEYLRFLGHHGLGDIVVVGGAVRDIFWGKEINDIDFTVKVNMTAEERKMTQSVSAPASHSMYEQATAALGQLAKALNIPVKQFFDRRNPPQFNGVNLHYLGPNLIHANEVHEDMFTKGLIVDAKSGNVYSSYTAPGLLEMAIDSEGRVYGYQQPLKDVLHGQVHMQGDLQNGRNLFILAIIKWLRLKYEYGLSLSTEDYSLVRGVLEQNENRTITSNNPTTHQAMQDLINGAENPQDALKELNDLGLVERTGFHPKIDEAMLYTPQNETKVTTLLRNTLDGLQYRDTIPANTRIDDIVILGNDDFDVFRHALRLWTTHRESRIVILGGKGRLTQSLIAKAQGQGVQAPEGSSEAVIIKAIMEKMISKDAEFSGFSPEFFLEDQSTTTPENIINYKNSITVQLDARDSQNPYQIIYLQTPHQQLRTKATVEKVLGGGIRSGTIEAFSDTPEYTYSQQGSIWDALGEALRLIIYSPAGNNSIVNVQAPNGFWQNVAGLYNSLPVEQKSVITPEFKKLIVGAGVTIGNMLPNVTAEQRIFLELIQKDFERMQLDRAMQVQTPNDLGGIALNAKMLDLQIKRDGNGVPLPISQQPLDKINIQGFVPQIISIQSVDLPALLGFNTPKEEVLAKV